MPSQASSSATSVSVAQPAVHGRSKVWIRWSVYVAIAVVAFGGGWRLAMMQAEQKHLIELSNVDLPKSEGIVVTATPIRFAPLRRFVEAVGTLYGFEEVTISSKNEGRVLRVHHDVASIVQPGELLLELDPTDAELAVAQAARSLQSELAKIGLTEVPNDSTSVDEFPTVVSARLRYVNAQARVQRSIPLRNTNAVSAEDFDQIQSEADILKSDLENQILIARHSVASARLKQAELDVAKQRLKECQIVAPIPTLTDGSSTQSYTVSERLVSEGSLLRPGTEVFKLVLGKTLKLRLAIPEANFENIQTGQTVEITTSTSKDNVLGTVKRISPTIDRNTRTVMVEIEVPNHDGSLRAGSFVRGRIITGETAEALLIPQEGLYSFAGITKIFVMENGVAREHKVTVGEKSGDFVELVSPTLPRNAIIITSGQKQLSDGISVTLRKATQETSTTKDTPAQSAHNTNGVGT
ncbi:MAG: efflux RND transporter periplasmic adaptor subunit [Planctomycetaceae bacterium]|nr:efflux RND transporter periplasmic adaptor subunit [Planctomycetaceae bacterium]